MIELYPYGRKAGVSKGLPNDAGFFSTHRRTCKSQSRMKPRHTSRFRHFLGQRYGPSCRDKVVTNYPRSLCALERNEWKSWSTKESSMGVGRGRMGISVASYGLNYCVRSGTWKDGHATRSNPSIARASPLLQRALEPLARKFFSPIGLQHSSDNAIQCIVSNFIHVRETPQRLNINE